METFVLQLLEAFPSAPFQMRQTTKELEFEGYRIPKGWLVCYGYASALWDEHAPITLPSIRSQASNNAGDNNKDSPTNHSTPAQSVAFGSGPRMCPGRFLAVSELLIFTQVLLQNPLELAPDQNLEQRYSPGFFPVDGLEAKLW